MKRIDLTLPPLDGRVLEVRGAHAWTHLEQNRGPARARCHGAEISETDEAVTLTLAGGGFWFGRNDLELKIPPGARVRFRVDAGGLHAEHLDGVDLDFATQAGTMHVEHMTGKLRLSTKSGTIHVEHFSGGFDVQTMAGAISMEIDDLVAGEHRARTYAGALHCELAGHIEADVDARATFGAVRNQARSFRDAVVKLSLVSDVGAVRVEQRGAAKLRDCPKSVEEVLERLAKGVLGVEQADALLDRLQRHSKKEHK